MRKSPVAIAGAIAFSFGVVATPAGGLKTLVWNFNIFGPPRAVTAGIEAMRDFYKKESNGALEIKIAYGAALGPERQAPESIKSGGYEGALMCAGYYPNKFPLLTVMELPFLPPRDIGANEKVNGAILEHPRSSRRWRSAGTSNTSPRSFFQRSSSWATSASHRSPT